jgi:hypothetical protein
MVRLSGKLYTNRERTMKLPRVAHAVSAALIIFGAARPGWGQKLPTARAVGLRVVEEGYTSKSESESQGSFAELRAFNWSAGTTVALLVSSAQGGLIAFDEKASQVESFSDDRGTNLLAGKKSGFSFNRGYGGGTVSRDGKACLIELKSENVPASGARTLDIKGKLVLSAAKNRKTYAAKGVKAKEGSEVKAGPIPMKIAKVGEPEWSSRDEKFAVTLEAQQALSNVAGIRFLDAGGKEIESSPGGSMATSMFGKTTVQRSFNFKEKLSAFTVEITYWTDLRRIEVPYRISIGVGL